METGSLHNCGNTTEATTLLQQFINKIKTTIRTTLKGPFSSKKAAVKGFSANI